DRTAAAPARRDAAKTRARYRDRFRPARPASAPEAGTSLAVFDQRSAAQLRQIALRQLLELGVEDRFAGLPFAGRVIGLGLGLAADRMHFDAELGDVGRAQLTDRNAVKELALFRRQVGGVAHDLLADVHLPELACERKPLVAAAKAAAQSLR